MSAHSSQLYNYLKSTEIEVGLLLNFGEEVEFERIILTNDKKQNLKSVYSVKSVYLILNIQHNSKI